MTEPNDATPFLPVKRTLAALREAAAAVEPEALVFLGATAARVPGATAAKAVFGSSFRVTRHRAELLHSELAPIVAATIHPSSILRQRDDESRHRERVRPLAVGGRRLLLGQHA